MGEALWIKPSIALVVIWSWFGWNVIIYLAGLQAIPTDLYEAARCDGASTPQIFRRITVPLLWPVINFTLILSIIGGLQLFDIPMILTSKSSGGVGAGGPENAGLTSMMYMYNSGFRYLKFGYAATISVALFVVIALFSFSYYKTIGRDRRD
jgi:ABC-type sugar transport system permease subunit